MFGVPSVRSKQRYAEPRPAPEPGARAVARLLVEIMHGLEHGEDARGAERVAHARAGHAGSRRPSITARSRSSGVAMRICAMSQPTLTMCATTRCATKPGESLITDTGTPSEASRAWADSFALIARHRGRHQRSAFGKAEQRIDGDGARGSSPRSSALVVASSPSGATKQTAAASGLRRARTRACRGALSARERPRPIRVFSRLGLADRRAFGDPSSP